MNNIGGLEYETTMTDEYGDEFFVAVTKAGGGTVGQSYVGRWEYLVFTEGQGVMMEGSDLETGTAKTHHQAAELVFDYFNDGVKP